MKRKLACSQVIIEQQIYFIRGERVMLDSDLAMLYGVTTKRLNEQVKRNLARFPKDFMFRLSVQEIESLRLRRIISTKQSCSMRSQNATASKRNVRYLPFVFTEHGAIMAANILNSFQAIQMSVFVVRAFVRLRKHLAGNKTLARKLSVLERKLTNRLDDHEVSILRIIEEIKKLMAPTAQPTKRKIGFHP